jgi:tetratricopeptide (TPR) repeat protein
MHLTLLRDFLFRHALAGKQPDDFEEHFIMSYILESLSRFFYEAKDFPLSLAHLSLAATLNPQDTIILNGLASCYLRLGRLPEAKKQAEHALDIDPRNITSLQLLGEVHLALEKYASAFACYQEILEQDPKNRFGLLGMGNYYAKVGNSEGARKLFRKVIVLGPDDHLAQKAADNLRQLNQRLLQPD